MSACKGAKRKRRATRTVDIETYCTCPKWRFAHLYFWTVEPKPAK